MTSGHILYIPLILILGVVVGFLLGRRASAQAESEAARRQRQRQGRVDQLRAELEERRVSDGSRAASAVESAQGPTE